MINQLIIQVEAESENASSSEDETTEYDQLLQVEKEGSILVKKKIFFNRILLKSFNLEGILSIKIKHIMFYYNYFANVSRYLETLKDAVIA